jgi:hypothetical protein
MAARHKVLSLDDAAKRLMLADGLGARKPLLSSSRPRRIAVDPMTMMDHVSGYRKALGGVRLL